MRERPLIFLFLDIFPYSDVMNVCVGASKYKGDVFRHVQIASTSLYLDPEQTIHDFL